jgi:hypothetical protein
MHATVSQTLGPQQIAVQFKDGGTAGTRMQAIDVLGQQIELRKPRRRLCQRPMTGIRLRLRNQCTPPRVPAPHQRRIRLEACARGQRQRIELRPKPGLRTAEGRHTAFGRDAGAGQHRAATRLRDPRAGRGEGIRRHRLRPVRPPVRPADADRSTRTTAAAAARPAPASDSRPAVAAPWPPSAASRTVAPYAHDGPNAAGG